MSHPYRTSSPKTLPPFSWIAFLSKWIEILDRCLYTVRPIILVCCGALAILGVIPFDIIIYFAAIEMIFQIRLCIITDCTDTRTRTFVWISVLILIFIWSKKSSNGPERLRDESCKEKAK